MTLELRERPRRNRKSAAVRAACRETVIGPEHFIYPLFVHGGDDDQPIGAMPGCSRLSKAGLMKEIEEAVDVGVGMVALFPKVPDELKDSVGTESHNPKGLIPDVLKMVKDRWPELMLVTDVALDPYSSDGHDGIVAPGGRILNDETVDVLCKQAVAQAAAGADIIAPSDMMDGRVGAIRDALDDEGYTDVSILSYTAKYASAFYGPFREALDSAPRGGDKKTYQMDPANIREALRELDLDESEGADMVMVKPAMAYLDVISALRDNTTLPIAAYQVSGEYAMLKAAAERGWLDEKAVVMESLLSIRRAGADIVLSYFAKDVGRWLAGG
ncbi:MAG: porphobilinogen synthase [Myxococcota bacterium]